MNSVVLGGRMFFTDEADVVVASEMLEHGYALTLDRMLVLD